MTMHFMKNNNKLQSSFTTKVVTANASLAEVPSVYVEQRVAMHTSSSMSCDASTRGKKDKTNTKHFS